MPPRPSLLQRLSSLTVSRVVYASELAQQLQEGDLIIFRGKAPHDCVIRCCTASEYNHIALVVQRRGELVLFEATAFGVGICPLEFYINSFYWTRLSSLFHKVVIRQLHTKVGRGLSNRMRGELYKYYDEMYGRDFQLNPLEYMLSWLNIEHAEDFTAVFCSELVAGGYKRMGLLPPEKGANAYMPNHFTERHRQRLPLLDGARLGKEKTIVFEHAPPLPSARASARASRELTARSAATSGRTWASSPSRSAATGEESSEAVSLGEGPSDASTRWPLHGALNGTAQPPPPSQLANSSSLLQERNFNMHRIVGGAREAGAKPSFVSSFSAFVSPLSLRISRSSRASRPSALQSPSIHSPRLRAYGPNRPSARQPSPQQPSAQQLSRRKVEFASAEANQQQQQQEHQEQLPPPPPPGQVSGAAYGSAEAARRLAERQLLSQVLAVYTLRKWMRRVVRARQRRAEAADEAAPELSSARTASAAATAASLAEVLVVPASRVRLSRPCGTGLSASAPTVVVRVLSAQVQLLQPS